MGVFWGTMMIYPGGHLLAKKIYYQKIVLGLGTGFSRYLSTLCTKNDVGVNCCKIFKQGSFCVSGQKKHATKNAVFVKMNFRNPPPFPPLRLSKSSLPASQCPPRCIHLYLRIIGVICSRRYVSTRSCHSYLCPQYHWWHPVNQG